MYEPQGVQFNPHWAFGGSRGGGKSESRLVREDLMNLGLHYLSFLTAISDFGLCASVSLSAEWRLRKSSLFIWSFFLYPCCERQLCAKPILGGTWWALTSRGAARTREPAKARAGAGA